MIVGSIGCCDCATASQCGTCSVYSEITLACRFIILSVNELSSSFKSWCEFDLLHQMVRLELVSQCIIQGDAMKERVCGVVGQSIIFADVRDELDLVSWDKGGTCLIL